MKIDSDDVKKIEKLINNQKNDAPPHLERGSLNRRLFHQGRKSSSAIENR